MGDSLIEPCFIRKLFRALGKPATFSRGNIIANVDKLVQVGAASMGPRLFSRGNLLGICLDDRPAGPASMGPRLFSRGNGFYYPIPASGSQCFNGATTFQPWK